MDVIGDPPPFLLLGLDDVGQEVLAVFSALAKLVHREAELSLHPGPLRGEGDDVGQSLDKGDVVGAVRVPGSRDHGQGADRSPPTLDGHHQEASAAQQTGENRLARLRICGDVRHQQRLAGVHHRLREGLIAGQLASHGNLVRQAGAGPDGKAVATPLQDSDDRGLEVRSDSLRGSLGERGDVIAAECSLAERGHRRLAAQTCLGKLGKPVLDLGAGEDGRELVEDRPGRGAESSLGASCDQKLVHTMTTEPGDHSGPEAVAAQQLGDGASATPGS